MPTLNTYCAIDFGTSNSAVAIASDRGAMRLAELESGQSTMPTAVFYHRDAHATQPRRDFGRAAIAAYVEGDEGRLMRSMKSVLGSSLVDQSTDLGGGHTVPFLGIVTDYLKRLVECATAHSGKTVRRALLGRPVYFVDDDPVRDASAQSALERAARGAGLDDIEFQYEPLAAAFDFERRCTREQIVMVADIGGGTSDFSVVRVGPDRIARAHRQDDILANHGVHVAGTDFDRHIELQAILRAYGYGASGPATAHAAARTVPSRVYFDLATWHLINTVYQPGRLAELQSMRHFYADPAHHSRLMTVVRQRLGHELAAQAEKAKIDVSGGGLARIDLGRTEPGLGAELTERQAIDMIDADMARIEAAARQAVAMAALEPAQIDALYFTGGSTGLRFLTRRLADIFPSASVGTGDRFASVATGLGLDAQRRYAR